MEQDGNKSTRSDGDFQNAAESALADCAVTDLEQGW
jgi:hypothetical protein